MIACSSGGRHHGKSCINHSTLPMRNKRSKYGFQTAWSFVLGFCCFVPPNCFRWFRSKEIGICWLFACCTAASQLKREGSLTNGVMPVTWNQDGAFSSVGQTNWLAQRANAEELLVMLKVQSACRILEVFDLFQYFCDVKQCSTRDSHYGF